MFKEAKGDTDFLGSERQNHRKIRGGYTGLICATGKYCSRKFLTPLVLVPGLMSVKCTGTAG